MRFLPIALPSEKTAHGETAMWMQRVMDIMKPDVPRAIKELLTVSDVRDKVEAWGFIMIIHLRLKKLHGIDCAEKIRDAVACLLRGPKNDFGSGHMPSEKAMTEWHEVIIEINACRKGQEYICPEHQAQCLLDLAGIILKDRHLRPEDEHRLIRDIELYRVRAWNVSAEDVLSFYLILKG